jgi:DNA-binding MarR family transcriptional regulator
MKSFDLATAPGHLIRRAHQTSAAIFAQETAQFEITSVQFAILQTLQDHPGLDQITVAKKVAFDPATSGSVIGRLETRGLLLRSADGADRRRKLLWLTPHGNRLCDDMTRSVWAVQERLLAPLSAVEREQFLRALKKINALEIHAERD